MQLRALSEVDKDDEITVSYLEDIFQPKSDRHRALGFACGCGVCRHVQSENVENAYAEVKDILMRAGSSRSQLPCHSLPDNFRVDGDWAQIRAVAEIAGGARLRSQVCRRYDKALGGDSSP